MPLSVVPQAPKGDQIQIKKPHLKMIPIKDKR